MGALAIAGYAAHAAWHAAHGRAENALWLCHLGALLVGAGLLAKRSLPIAAGFYWLSGGLPLWLLDLTTGGEFVATSPLTHVVGPILGAIGLRRLGTPKHVWAVAAVAFVPLILLCRLTPPGENVNFAHAVWAGWEKTFPSHAAYVALLLGGGSILFFIEEKILRAVFPDRQGR
jgi:hypothetical protein